MLKKALIMITALLAMPLYAKANVEFITETQNGTAAAPENPFEPEAGSSLSNVLEQAAGTTSEASAPESNVAAAVPALQPAAANPFEAAATEAEASTPPALIEADLPKTEELLVSVDLDAKAMEADARFGQIIEVTLDEETPKEWQCDKGNKVVKFISMNRDTPGEVKISFEAVKEGFERLYFDYVDRSNGSIKVIESRIVDVSVGS